jgi:hypothetical protein
MLLTISTTHFPATDLGYLLYKNPSQVQMFELSFGQVHVFYPEADPGQCCAMEPANFYDEIQKLLLEIQIPWLGRTI